MQIDISESSQVGDARRRVLAFAEDIGIVADRLGAVALATTEIATNLVKHAGGGYLLIHKVSGLKCEGLRIISVDRGPGIADLPAALRDGHSTAGTMGAGLGSIKRVADFFEVYSVPGNGAVIGIEFWGLPHSRPPASLDFSVVAEPILGETVSGDGWGVSSTSRDITFMLADGLGHGVLASEAAQEAQRILSLASNASLGTIISDAHDALKKTRGAAVALARLETGKGLLTFAGVGNISASIVTPAGTRSMASHNGTVGQHVARIQEFNYPWTPESLLVLHSDGLATRWDLQRYPGLFSKGPSLIAAMLHRDFSRGRDDVTILVARSRRPN
jgi:anti-sigma regulatory factor (Ser/Thr protein kinase)